MSQEEEEPAKISDFSKWSKIDTNQIAFSSLIMIIVVVLVLGFALTKIYSALGLLRKQIIYERVRVNTLLYNLTDMSEKLSKQEMNLYDLINPSGTYPATYLDVFNYEGLGENGFGQYFKP
jgi:hypothetical protein